MPLWLDNSLIPHKLQLWSVIFLNMKSLSKWEHYKEIATEFFLLFCFFFLGGGGRSKVIRRKKNVVFGLPLVSPMIKEVYVLDLCLGAK